ncbi:hypothetical protein B0H13DRAFT_1891022 [Mycena leptocephala]|nr:hypothetical protein B0H13DRAFT_1891022 [Mycena leptocephala]
MSTSPTSLGIGTPFASSAPSSPMPTPARLWSDFSSVPASTAASSPAPEDDGEMKEDAQDMDANTNLAEDGDEETPFLRGVLVSDASSSPLAENQDASSSPPDAPPSR